MVPSSLINALHKAIRTFRSKAGRFWLGMGVGAFIVLLVFWQPLTTHLGSGPIGDTDPASRLGIKDVIEQVHLELSEADEQKRSANRATLFELKSMDLEISFVIKASASRSGSTRVELITVDSKSEYSKEKVQKVTLHMVVPPPEKKVVRPTSSGDMGEGTPIDHGPKPREKGAEE